MAKLDVSYIGAPNYQDHVVFLEGQLVGLAQCAVAGPNGMITLLVVDRPVPRSKAKVGDCVMGLYVFSGNVEIYDDVESAKQDHPKATSLDAKAWVDKYQGNFQDLKCMGSVFYRERMEIATSDPAAGYNQ